MSGIAPQKLPAAGPAGTIIASANSVNFVRQQVQALLPQAYYLGFATVPAAVVQNWQNLLRSASFQLQQVPTPLIFPPPAFTVFLGQAESEIQRAITLLGTLDAPGPFFVPQKFGQVTIPLSAHLALLSTLNQALSQLFFALQAV